MGGYFGPQLHCHLERSEAESKDLLYSPTTLHRFFEVADCYTITFL